MDKKIGIIGAGNMGSALFRGISKIISGDRLFIADPNQHKIDQFPKEQTFLDASEMVDQVDAVIFAVKPQDFSMMIYDLDATVYDKLLVSIMAGITIDKIVDLTGGERIVRAMPNLGAVALKSVTAWIATEDVDVEEIKLIKTVFESIGQSIQVGEEDQLNSITAISGSGPAYFLNLCEIMEQKAVELGFDEAQAKSIVKGTMEGSLEIIKQNNSQENPENILTTEELKNSVISKSGTTEAALNYLNSKDYSEIVKQSIQKAANRSFEISGGII